jgi:hypothetical protein
MDVADRVRECVTNGIGGANFTSVHGVDGRKLAEIIRLPPMQGEAQWIGAQFAQTPALRAAVTLGLGELAVPGQPSVAVPLCPLGQLGDLGPDRKRIHEGFTVSETDWSPYPSFWNHDSKTVKSIRQQPNSWLTPWADSPRGPDYGPRLLWPRSGRIFLVERVRTTTHRMLAIGFDVAALGNTWWAFKSDLSSEQEKALLLWLNSTPSILMMLARRVTTEGAWMQVKQPQWAAMPVLDVRNLPAETLTRLAGDYDALCSKELLALAKLDVDPIRGGIDDALSAALGLPDMKPLRQLLTREPGLTGQSLSPKPGQTALFSEAELRQDVAAQLRLI